jgi:hypothetical protein
VTFSVRRCVLLLQYFRSPFKRLVCFIPIQLYNRGKLTLIKLLKCTEYEITKDHSYGVLIRSIQI